MAPISAARRHLAPKHPLGRTSLRRRSLRRCIERPITEGASDRQIRFREALSRRSLAVADVLAAAVALVVCVNVLGSDSLRPIALLALPLIIVAGKAHGLYDRDELVVNKTTMDQAPALFQCATLYALLVVLLQSWFVDGSLSPIQVVGLWGTLFVAALLARRIARCVARRLSAVERCLFVGGDASFERLRSKLPEGEGRPSLVGRMSLDPLSEQMVDVGAVTLRRLIENLDVHRVIIEPSEALPQVTLDFVRAAKATGVRVSLLPRILEVVGSTIEVDDVNGLTLLGLRRFGLSRTSKTIKRGFDATGAALGLIALSPLLLVFALLIKLDSRGPVIFRQPRVGRDGRAFRMWKYRTMIVGADELKAGLRARNDPATGLFKLPDDPRVTRLGRWLRRSSLDELPQLVNVLRGQMSLVGPRPLPVTDRPYVGEARRRLLVKPGLTGLWQISGRSDLDWEESVRLDLRYVEQWSLALDALIIWKTVFAVVNGRGAY